MESNNENIFLMRSCVREFRWYIEGCRVGVRNFYDDIETEKDKGIHHDMWADKETQK